MLTISSGHSADYLLGAVAVGRENYYTGAVAAGEPPGRWYGAGALQLGLCGLVDHQDMTALYEHFIDPRDPAFRDPSKWREASTLGHSGRRYATEDELYKAALDAEPDADAERRAELRLDAGKRARRNVAFLDATFSVQKSITVLHAAFEAQQVAAENAAAQAAEAGDDEGMAQARQAAESWSAHKDAVEDAIWAGNRAGLDYLADRAGYSRVGHHGGAAGRFSDAHDWVVASFFQHDSRDHDPQLHIHNAILNRVQAADGTRRTLDSRAVHRFRGAGSSVAERTTEEHLTRSLGVRFATRPDGRAREIVGVPAEVMDLFSSRRRAITRRTAELAAAFEGKFGRPPNGLESDRLARQATFATRRAKSHQGESVETRLERWDRELRAEVAGGLAAVADQVLDGAQESPDPARWTQRAVIEAALADVQTKKAAWTAPDLTRALSDALPDHLGDLDGNQIEQLLAGLTRQALELAVPLDAERPGDTAVPDELRLADGRSAYEAPGRRLYATPEHLRTERLLRASTAERTTPALTTRDAQLFVDALAESGIELGADQAAALRGVLTSGAVVESLVGPAGTGKSFVVGALAKAWQDPALWDGHSRRVVGLAASQIATEILAGEGLDACNIARWLATQDRLDNGTGAAEDEPWRLRRGDLVVVDESAMAATTDLARIHGNVSAAGAKLLLTGDHRQLAAVDAGGAMELIAEAGVAYELAEARRFHHAWEADASLRLRGGDESVVGEYHKHGRLLDCGAREQAEASAARAWLADTLAGRHALLLVDSNEQAARLSAELRADLVRLGQVAEHGVPLGLQGTYAGQGDLVQARLNGWHLTGYEGNRRGPINREQYRVLHTRDDGGLVVAPILDRSPDREQLGEQMTLPRDYVAQHVALGYASTVHAAQGLTVETSHTVATQQTGAKALYVGMSRGRECNTAHITTRAVPTDAPSGEVNEALHRNARAVLAGAFETVQPERSALATAVESGHEAESVRTPGELLADAAELATASRTAAWLDQLVDVGALTADERTRIAAEDGGPALARLLRRAELAGHDPRRVLTDAVTSHSLDGSRQLTNVIHHRITTSVWLDPQGDTYAEWTPRVDDPAWQHYLDTLAGAADNRRRELGEQVLAERPPWAVEAIGPPPAGDARSEWVHRAGIVAAHRELTGHDDPETALGASPKPGQVEAYASWRAAWRALGQPEADRDELEMTDGRLRLRVRAYDREKAWAPRYVANELAGSIQAAEKHRQTATVRAAEAKATANPERRVKLEGEADQAATLADLLDQRVGDLTTADEARAQWYAHTAETRAAAERAAAELSAREVERDAADEPVTAEEWLAEAAAADRAEDPNREVRAEYELVDEAGPAHEPDQASTPDMEPAEAAPPGQERTVGMSTADHTDRGSPAALDPERPEGAATDEIVPDRDDEQAHVDGTRAPASAAESPDKRSDAERAVEPDIRETTAREPQQEDEEDVRVPTADETAQTIARAQRALAEIRRREHADRQRAQEERADQLSRWHDADTTERDRAAERAADALEPEGAR